MADEQLQLNDQKVHQGGDGLYFTTWQLGNPERSRTNFEKAIRTFYGSEIEAVAQGNDLVTELRGGMETADVTGAGAEEALQDRAALGSDIAGSLVLASLLLLTSTPDEEEQSDHQDSEDSVPEAPVVADTPTP